jgi:hypothetical protein
VEVLKRTKHCDHVEARRGKSGGIQRRASHFATTAAPGLERRVRDWLDANDMPAAGAFRGPQKLSPAAADVEKGARLREHY